MRKWFARGLLHPTLSGAPSRREPDGRSAPEGGVRRRKFVRKDELFSVSKMNFANRSPHAQAPSVPIRRAGRRARDRIQVLLYALRGEKSPIGGICNPSVAPLLHRKSLREVRSEFSWTAAFAEGRSNGTLAHFFFGTFFFCAKKKVHCPPAKGDCAQRGRLCGNGVHALSSTALRRSLRPWSQA